MNPLSLLLGPIFSTIDDIITDKDKAEQLKIQLQTVEVQGQLQLALSQANLDANEANSRSLFVAGWRPFIGWVGGIAFAYQMLIIPLVTFVCTVFGFPIPPLPILLTKSLLKILTGMLGLG